MTRSAVTLIALAAGFAAIAGCATSKAPTESPDGLVLRPNSDFSAVYVRPGASLADYPMMGAVPCEVSFRKNWLRDQNSNRVSLNNRVSQKDVDQIEDALAEECDKYFRDALLQPPPYTLVEEFNEGDSILILRPSIVDLDVSAPDTMSPGMSRTYTTQAGRMTLVLEIFDGSTGEILVRAIDKRRSTDAGSLQWSNGVTNRAEADRILKAWSSKLRKGLDAAIKL
jgi:hypothetical protein